MVGAPGVPRPGRQLTLPWAAKKKRIWGAFGAPNGFKNVTRSMRIPNMCLLLKLDNGKVVSIANGHSDRITEPHSNRISI